MQKEKTSSTKKKRIKKIIFRTILVIFSLLLLLSIAIGVILNTLVTPERLTPIVLSLSKDYVDGELQCNSIDITFFSTFPDLGIKLENGCIIAHNMLPDSIVDPTISAQDSLIVFENFTVALNPVEFLLNKKFIVHKLDIKNANIYAFVNENGKANWDIFNMGETTEDEEVTDEIFETPELNINNIRLQNINLIYDNVQEDTFIMIDSLAMRLSGNMSKEDANLNLGLRTKGITCYYQGEDFTDNLKFGVRTKVKRDRVKKSIELDRAVITVGTLQFKANGIMENSEDRETIYLDIDYNLDASSISELLAMIPNHISDLPSKIIAKGEILTNGKINGTLGKGKVPVVTCNMQLKNGSLGSVKYPKKAIIEKIEFDFKSFIDLSGANPSTLNLNKFYVQTASSELSLKGDFDDLLNNIAINTSANAKINFTQLAQKLSFIEGTEMKGNIDFDLQTSFLLNDILTSNYGKINANGTANIRNISYLDQNEDIHFYASNAAMRFGSNTQDSIRGRLLESLLRGTISLDSINIKMKDEVKASAGKLSARFSTSEPADTNSIAPVSTSARVSNIRVVMGDSVQMLTKAASASIRALPQKNNPSLPEINIRMSLDTLFGRFFTMGGRVNEADLNLKFIRLPNLRNRIPNRTISRNDSTTRLTAQNDTIRRNTRRNTISQVQRDSLRQRTFNQESNLSFRLESKETRDILQKWELSGDADLNYISVRTPVFPLPIRMHKSDFSFTSNKISIKQTDMQLGSSHVSLKGDIEGIRAALLYNGKISAKLTMTADSLDFNQLIRAAVAGSEYMEKSSSEKNEISEFMLDESNDPVIEASVDTTDLGVFVVPRNLDLEFNSFIRNGKFNAINIKNTRGRIIIRDQAIHLPRFTLNTDIGSANTTLVYKAPDKNGAHVGLELKVNKIDIKELIGTFPMMDDITPMLKSFEGVVDCELSAITQLDSLMNVKLDQTTASSYVHGKNLVLLDGETFAEISKMLRFKNKNRNLIDSVSVEFILEDEKLMIFPFVISMDRYQAAVGGIQNLDMSFDYHITVLKSPIPFKLGLNISGNPDKMKIRLAKAKYKNIFSVAREKDLDNTVINLREQMQQTLQKNIEEIVGADLSKPVRRPRTLLPDSLRNAYFQMDTTVVELDSISGEAIPVTE